MAGPIVITGGGTGGHIFPMQAVSEQLQILGINSNDLRYVGSRRGQEAMLLAGGAVALTLLPGRGIRRSWKPRAIAENLGAAFGLVTAVLIAMYKVGRWRPSVVVSVGGYASFAVSFAAVLWRRPLVLVELDAGPGAAHRVFGRFAARWCTAFDSSEPRSSTTGAPLRDAIVAIDRSASARSLARGRFTPHIDHDRQVVVVMTGSLGASTVNIAVSGLARLWSARTDRTIIHVTGRRDFTTVSESRPETSGLDYRIIPFGDMTELWAVCDVAVCRAGASTIAELTALGIASVLVPLPGAPGDHQTKNAEALARAGGARLIVDRECSAQVLANILDEVMNTPDLAAMTRAASSLGHRDGALAIARVVLETSVGP